MKHRIVLPTLICSLMAVPAFAKIERQHGSHVHGTGKLQVAIEGNKLGIQLEAPAFDIVGFGHEAKSAEDKKTVQAALAKLKAGDKMFTLSSAAGCKLEKVNVERETEEHDDHDKGHKKDAHDDHDKDHKKDAHDDHDKDHKKDAHDDHDKEKSTHSEYHAQYNYKCGALDKLDSIKTDYFKTFERAEKLNVQWVNDKGQGQTSLTKGNPVVQFKK